MSLRFPSFQAAALVLGCSLLGIGPVPAGPVDVNTADAPTIARNLKGIGLVRAQAIVDYRTRNGPFRSADELALVKGIGPKMIENNRADIRTTARPAPVATPSAPRRQPVRSP